MKTIFVGSILAACWLLLLSARGQQGDLVQSDLAKARRGDANAQLNLGNRYSEGLGVMKDGAEAKKWYRKAAEQGNAEAEYHLACFYLGGSKEDEVIATKWFRKAADHGEVRAQNEMAVKCFHGEGVAQDYAEAVKWYGKAAAQGDAMAQGNLAYCYLNGYGVAKNEAEAARLYQMAGINYYPNVPTPVVSKLQQPAVPAPTTSAPDLRVSAANPVGIDMYKANGVLKVPVQINGAITLKFTLDSGASCIQIPADVALTLIRAETISERDFLPGQTMILADGSRVKSERLILHSIKVGEMTFSDIEANIGGSNSELLLGQTFLSRFSEWKIDNKNAKLILTK